MGQHIQLNIADPCHENWDNMTQAEQGRFCASCQKQVVDFTNMSDSQLAVFFKKPAEVSVCGRFFQDQLDREIEIPRKRMPWVKYFFQFALPAFLFSMKATAQGKVRVQKKDPTVLQEIVLVSYKKPSPVNCVQTSDAVQLQGKVTGPVVKTNKPVADLSLAVKSTPQLIKDAGKIRGRVIDEKGDPLPFATVIMKGTKSGTVTNAAGEFSIVPEAKWESVVLVVSYVGFETQELKVTNDSPAINVVLQVGLQSMVQGLLVCTKSSKKKQPKSIPVLTQKLIDTAFKFFKLSPNPVERNNAFYLGFNNDQEEVMQLNILSINGNLVLTRSEKIVKGNNRVSVTTDTKWTAGIYIIELRNEKGTLIRQEKLVVQ